MKKDGLEVSTTEASAAVAQSRGEQTASVAESRTSVCPGLGSRFDIGPRVYRAVQAQPYERRSTDPIYRPLRIYSIDPSVSKREGATALVNVPYEPLDPGPVGALFEVDNLDRVTDLRYRQVDLAAPEVLIRIGRTPSPSDPQFHQQMVYAVCSLVYAAFESALGRHIAWGYDLEEHGDARRRRLRLVPHAAHASNAYYDERRGELCFGYYRAGDEVAGHNKPGGYVFTCLSHDIIAHEVTHALLDGLRAHFTLPSGPDVLAFHESFADLVALFQHFSYDEVVKAGIRRSRGELRSAELLFGIARQLGQTTGRTKALRTVVEDCGDTQALADASEPHERGIRLTCAVFDAFVTVFGRKTERYVRLATNGTGVLPPGELPADLVDVLAKEASQLASQFLAMCIRAIDYCPPIDIEFGEFLRAVLTADFDLVPDDPWGYREAWIYAFRKHAIYPKHVDNLSEDAVLWHPPIRALSELDALSFSSLAFNGDPCRPAGEDELRRQACALGHFVTRPENFEVFGLADPEDPRLEGDLLDPPCVESIRSSRRSGPSGQVVFDLVAEVTQRRVCKSPDGRHTFDFYGGATIILGPRGEVRYVISKSVLNEERLAQQKDFVFGSAGKPLFAAADGAVHPRPQLFRLVHDFIQQTVSDTR